MSMSDVTQWTVLVVDDNPDFTQLVKQMLEHHGATVHTASGGQQCIDMAQAIQPTLIITDLSMPEVDGWQAFKAVHANATTAHIPVVAITAYHSPEVETDAFQMGFSGYFPKPVEATRFVEQLSAIFN
jgi:CheY-like chemotaxis protein